MSSVFKSISLLLVSESDSSSFNLFKGVPKAKILNLFKTKKKIINVIIDNNLILN